MDDREFLAAYGVTPRQVDEAIEENRRQAAARLTAWGYAWAVDDILCDVAVELMNGGLRRWAAYPDRRPLGAFVNTLVGNRLGEWMASERPKYRGGMTHAPGRSHKRVAGQGDGDGVDAADAGAVRARLRREERAAGMGRVCEEDDVTGGPEDTGCAGDRASYQAWAGDPDGPDDDGQDGAGVYLADMRVLKRLVRARYGPTAWDELMRRCTTGRDPSRRLAGEIRHWLESHHAGAAPDIDAYPHMRRVLGSSRATGR